MRNWGCSSPTRLKLVRTVPAHGERRRGRVSSLLFLNTADVQCNALQSLVAELQNRKNAF